MAARAPGCRRSRRYGIPHLRDRRAVFSNPFVEHAEARGDRAVGAAPVGFLYFRPVTEALHGDGRQIAVAQRRVEREQELVPGREVALGASFVDAAALDEPVMADVVRRAIPAGHLCRQRSVLRHQDVEGDAAAVLVLTEDAEVARQPLGQLVSRPFVEVDGETDGAGPEGVRRTPHAVRAELLAQPPVHRRKRRGAADHVDTGQLGPGHLVLSPAGIAHGGFHRRERLLDQRGAGVVDLVDGDHGFVDDELPRVRIERLLLLADLVEQVRSQRAASAL